jgi:hypothetical protein
LLDQKRTVVMSQQHRARGPRKFSRYFHFALIICPGHVFEYTLAHRARLIEATLAARDARRV